MKKNYLFIAIGIVMVISCSVGYHQYLLKEKVKEDVNANFIESSSVEQTPTQEEVVPVSVEEEEIDVIKSEIEPKEEDNSFEDTSSGETVNISQEVMADYTEPVSNEKCAWGFVRKSGGKQPDFYGPHAKILDEYNGIYVGSNEETILYLTFDEGYENGYTASILDTLKEKGVTATFFVTMPYVKQNSELVQRMIDEGHIVGNHTVNHLSLPEVTDDAKLINEVMELHQYMIDHFQYEMKYLRPPKGEFSARTVKMCLSLGYQHVLWSSAYADWDTSNQKGSEYAKKMICDYLHNGNVMLLHAVSKDNANVLGEVIDEARNRGYTFASLDSWEKE